VHARERLLPISEPLSRQASNDSGTHAGVRRGAQFRVYNEVTDDERVPEESHLSLVAIADRRESRIVCGAGAACRRAVALVMADDNRPVTMDAFGATCTIPSARRSSFIA